MQCVQIPTSSVISTPAPQCPQDKISSCIKHGCTKHVVPCPQPAKSSKPCSQMDRRRSVCLPPFLPSDASPLVPVSAMSKSASTYPQHSIKQQIHQYVFPFLRAIKNYKPRIFGGAGTILPGVAAVLKFHNSTVPPHSIRSCVCRLTHLQLAWESVVMNTHPPHKVKEPLVW